MQKLTERDIISQFIGNTVSQEHFNKIGYSNGENNYLICNADYINNPQLCEAFGITDRLKWKWGYSGVDFTIYLTIVDNTIREGHIYKAKDSCSGHGRSSSQVLSISQQELRVAKRILQYITE